jgi:hypothetical protein
MADIWEYNFLVEDPDKAMDNFQSLFGKLVKVPKKQLKL